MGNTSSIPERIYRAAKANDITELQVQPPTSFFCYGNQVQRNSNGALTATSWHVGKSSEFSMLMFMLGPECEKFRDMERGLHPAHQNRSSHSEFTCS